MDIRPVDILHNIRQWNFEVLGQYHMSKDEANVVINLILENLGKTDKGEDDERISGC